MAKKFNIIRNITDQIMRGNTYIDKDGNFLSEDDLKKNSLDEFKREINAGNYNTTYEQFVEKKKVDMLDAEQLLIDLTEAYHLSDRYSNVDPDGARPEDLFPSDAMPEPEQADSKPKSKKKDGEE